MLKNVEMQPSVLANMASKTRKLGLPNFDCIPTPLQSINLHSRFSESWHTGQSSMIDSLPVWLSIFLWLVPFGEDHEE